VLIQVHTRLAIAMTNGELFNAAICTVHHSEREREGGAANSAGIIRLPSDPTRPQKVEDNQCRCDSMLPLSR
jgi:hypothetical protein